ncbi:hypothetical protein LMG26684_04226 [Achromobacter mucicolens]|nr:hypothetical protein LMG26684_04226 [Achromobacter mucicolens]
MLRRKLDFALRDGLLRCWAVPKFLNLPSAQVAQLLDAYMDVQERLQCLCLYLGDWQRGDDRQYVSQPRQILIDVLLQLLLACALLRMFFIAITQPIRQISMSRVELRGSR